VGTAFTYQGRLNDGGIPASSDYDFQFALYDDLAGGNQLGNTIDQTITVDDGYFTTLLDFGQAFQGEARYLEVRVRTAGTGDPFTTLTPRQALTPVPYSLALPGLWTEQNATSPNVIGGFAGNTSTAGAVGVTISGGGASGSVNDVADNYGTVGGGSHNRVGSVDGDPANAAFATVGGGNGNLANGSGSTVSGGLGNAASGSSAFVGGGLANSAGSNHATIGGGQHNSASGFWSTVTGGFSNIATASGAFVGGGGNNGATATNATVGGGQLNSATGEWSTVPGGGGNVAAGGYSLAAGRRAKANHPGSLVWGDSADTDVASTANNQVVVRASGGISVTAGTGIWRLEPNATSPNLIGGYSGNSVAIGIVGGTIGGGGASIGLNTVTGNYGTVAGGIRNTVRDHYGTVGGGVENLAHNAATVGGGWGNQASLSWSTIGGGAHNRIDAESATIAGGWGNTVTGSTGAIGGGSSNTAGQPYATVGGGIGNRAEGDYATIGGGLDNNATGGKATITGGQDNVASAEYGAIPGGRNALAAIYGQMAYASGEFSAGGDAQTSVYVLRNVTTNTTPTPLYLDGSTERLTVAAGRTLAFEIMLVARSSAAASAGYRIQGVIENHAGSTGFVGAPTVTTLGEDVAAWNISVQADDATDALVIQVIGAADTMIRWVATVRASEVAW
jgi:hypothetical protein